MARKFKKVLAPKLESEFESSLPVKQLHLNPYFLLKKKYLKANILSRQLKGFRNKFSKNENNDLCQNWGVREKKFLDSLYSQRHHWGIYHCPRGEREKKKKKKKKKSGHFNHLASIRKSRKRKGVGGYKLSLSAIAVIFF